MASIPHTTSPSPEQQPIEPEQSSSSTPRPSTEQRRQSVPKSTTSLDSQTVFVNDPEPSSSRAEQKSPEPQSTSESDDEPRRCWICFSDETEDTEKTSEWRSPCPCALTAHEGCLLDWIADIESPNSGKSGKLECPQCKSKIRVARPSPFLLRLFKKIEAGARQGVIPGIVLAAAGSLWTGALVHGMTSVLLIFGREDFEKLLGTDNTGPISFRWAIGLPFVPFVLMLSRGTMADGFLPALPILFFASAVDGKLPKSTDLWPPSAAMTIALLPFVRGFYNEIYKRLFAERSKRWIRQTRPGHNEGNEERGGNANQGINGDPGLQNLERHLDQRNIFGFNLEVEIIEERVRQPNPRDREQAPVQAPRPAPEQAAEQAQTPGQPQPYSSESGGAGAERAPANGNESGVAENRPQSENGGQAPEGQAEQPAQPAGEAAAPAPAPNQVDNHLERANELVLTSGNIVEAMVGALCFPAVASIMGTLLNWTLPKYWTEVTTLADRRPSLLQTKWGRSIVGGCVFVVVKDGMILYSRYRTAKDHQQRSVLNYEGPRGKGRDKGKEKAKARPDE